MRVSRLDPLYYREKLRSTSFLQHPLPASLLSSRNHCGRGLMSVTPSENDSPRVSHKSKHLRCVQACLRKRRRGLPLDHQGHPQSQGSPSSVPPDTEGQFLAERRTSASHVLVQKKKTLNAQPLLASRDAAVGNLDGRGVRFGFEVFLPLSAWGPSPLCA